jgi:hypothetical protein
MFMPAVIAFVEFIVYLCTSDEGVAAKYNLYRLLIDPTGLYFSDCLQLHVI